jgi:transposase
MAENIKHGESVYRNAKRYGVSETTIKGWLLPYRIEGFKKKAEQAGRRKMVMKKHCEDGKDTVSLSDIYKKEFYWYENHHFTINQV